MNLFSMWRLKSANAGTFFRVGLTMQVARRRGPARGGRDRARRAADGGAVHRACRRDARLSSGPPGSSRYMGFFRELAGSASSVYTTMMFFLGGTFGWLSGVLNDGTLLPVAAMMLGASLTANAISWGLPRRAVPAAA